MVRASSGYAVTVRHMTRSGAMGRRRLHAALLTGCLVAMTAAVGAAPATAAAAEGSAPFFGESIELGKDVFASPTVTSGTYVTSIEDGAPRYLDITRSIPNSTVWMGVSTQKPPEYADLDAEAGDGDVLTAEDTLAVDVYGDGDTGRSCGEFNGSVQTDAVVETEPFQTALFNSGGEACRDASSITMRIASSYTVDAPIATQIVVWEEPPVDDQRGLPQASTSIAWSELPPAGEPEQITPGTSYADAPDVSSGTFSFRVERGQPAFFRMPLDWGQHGQALLTTDAAFAEPGGGVSSGQGYPAVRWVGPMGGVTQEMDLEGAPKDTWTGLDRTEAGTKTLPTASPIVAWNARKTKDTENIDARRMSGLAGSYFLVVAGNQALTDDGAEITLQTGYFADYAGGVPDYQEKPSAMPQVFDAGPDAVTATSAREVVDVRPPGPPWTTIWSLLGAAAVVAAVGAGALIRRGRTA